MPLREWVSITDPDDSSQTYVVDVTFMLSTWQCIFGRGCPGTDGRPDDDRGCCRLGAHYTDDADRRRVEGAFTLLGPDTMQHHAEALAGGFTEADEDGLARTRMVGDACIFLNRRGFPTGAGCALHQVALASGRHPTELKPEVCWLVPIRREWVEQVGDDGEPCWITTVTSYDRGAWGPGGSDLAWWCTTDDDRAYSAPDPVYVSLEAELRLVLGDGTYEELVEYLRWREREPREPLRTLPIVTASPRLSPRDPPAC